MKRPKPVTCSRLIVAAWPALAADADLEERRSIVLERSRHHRSNLIRCFGGQPRAPAASATFAKSGLLQVGSEIEETGRLHLQLDKGQGVVLKTIT